MRGAGIGVALWLAAPSLAAQATAPADAVAGFVAAVRSATERYRDRAAAIADGYRPIGPDFPSMGEHWVSVPLVVRGEVDPLHPPILEYVTIDGRPLLAGVAYSQLVRDGIPDTTPVPAPRTAWHYHAGSVDEESFILAHASPGDASAPIGRPSVAVLHAWLFLDNPAGIFATDNWALPWYRLGFSRQPAGEVASGADLAAALAAGGDDYFATLLRLRFRLEGEVVRRAAEALRRHGDAIRSLLRDAAAGGRPVPESALARAWNEAESEIGRLCEGCRLGSPAHHRSSP